LERLPGSYREFLCVCDGIENFSASYGLFGAQDLLSPIYPKLLDNVLKNWIGFEYEPERPPMLIGYDPETRTRVFFEFKHLRTAPNEPIVIDGNPGDMTLHQSFRDFLEACIDANLHTIAELIDLREGKVEE
jgi:hypothetical protein